MGKILIVEDNEFNRIMLSRRLELKKYKVICAVDGQEGIDLAKSENPDLILMDLSLPVKDGWEATKELKNDSKTKDIPIIALTAHALDSDKKQAFEAGCDEYETKPIKFQQLLSKMSALIKN